MLLDPACPSVASTSSRRSPEVIEQLVVQLYILQSDAGAYVDVRKTLPSVQPIQRSRVLRSRPRLQSFYSRTDHHTNVAASRWSLLGSPRPLPLPRTLASVEYLASLGPLKDCRRFRSVDRAERWVVVLWQRRYRGEMGLSPLCPAVKQRLDSCCAEIGTSTGTCRHPEREITSGRIGRSCRYRRF